MDEAEVVAQIERIIHPLLDAEAVELVDLNLAGGKRRRLLRVFVDRPGGITVDECAHLNRMIGVALDVEDPIEGPYVLEVSSPGLDRALKKEKDFARSTGRKVRVILSSGVVHIGILRACLGDSILLEVSGEPLKVALDTVARANLEVEF